MALTVGDESYKLQGILPPTIALVTSNSMQRLIQQENVKVIAQLMSLSIELEKPRMDEKIQGLLA